MVFMMDKFFTEEWPPEFFFHHEPVFTSVRLCFGNPDVDVTVATKLVSN